MKLLPLLTQFCKINTDHIHSMTHGQNKKDSYPINHQLVAISKSGCTSTVTEVWLPTARSTIYRT